MAHKTAEARRDYQRKRYHENPELYKKYQKKWNDKNKERMAAYRKVWLAESQRKNPEKWKQKHLKYVLRKKYGVSVEWYFALLKKQKGVCAICGKKETDMHQKTGLSGPRPRRLAVDHCHITKKNRGLLCARCNKSLHVMEEMSDWAQRAITYLEKYK